MTNTETTGTPLPPRINGRAAQLREKYPHLNRAARQRLARQFARNEIYGYPHDENATPIEVVVDDDLPLDSALVEGSNGSRVLMINIGGTLDKT